MDTANPFCPQQIFPKEFRPEKNSSAGHFADFSKIIDKMGDSSGFGDFEILLNTLFFCLLVYKKVEFRHLKFTFVMFIYVLGPKV